jgi:hypothetical protein
LRHIKICVGFQRQLRWDIYNDPAEELIFTIRLLK